MMRVFWFHHILSLQPVSLQPVSLRPASAGVLVAGILVAEIFTTKTPATYTLATKTQAAKATAAKVTAAKTSAAKTPVAKTWAAKTWAAKTKQGCRYFLQMTGSSVSISWKLTDSMIILLAISPSIVPFPKIDRFNGTCWTCTNNSPAKYDEIKIILSFWTVIGIFESFQFTV